MIHSILRIRYLSEGQNGRQMYYAMYLDIIFTLKWKDLNIFTNIFQIPFRTFTLKVSTSLIRVCLHLQASFSLTKLEVI